jgi:hypothetical protein
LSNHAAHIERDRYIAKKLRRPLTLAFFKTEQTSTFEEALEGVVGLVALTELNMAVFVFMLLVTCTLVSRFLCMYIFAVHEMLQRM